MGEGAKRTRTGGVTTWLREETAECQIPNVQFRNSSFDIRDWTLLFSHGEGGIRTPDKGISPYNGLANRRLQPLGHLSNVAAQ